MKKGILLTILCLGFLLQSCGHYSFTGADVHPDLKTFTVSRVINQSGSVNPNLSIDIQDKLVNRLNRQTTLQELPSGGGLLYDIVIDSYALQATSISSGAVASESKFQIGIKCTFTNSKDEKKDFEKKFSVNRNFPSTTTFQDAEAQLLDEMIDELVDKIFNESLVNW